MSLQKQHDDSKEVSLSTMLRDKIAPNFDEIVGRLFKIERKDDEIVQRLDFMNLQARGAAASGSSARAPPGFPGRRASVSMF